MGAGNASPGRDHPGHNDGLRHCRVLAALLRLPPGACTGLHCGNKHSTLFHTIQVCAAVSSGPGTLISPSCSLISHTKLATRQQRRHARSFPTQSVPHGNIAFPPRLHMAVRLLHWGYQTLRSTLPYGPRRVAVPPDG